NFVMPGDLVNGPATVTIRDGNGTGQTAEVLVDRVAPALFTANANGLGVPAALLIRVGAGGTQSTEPVFQCGATGGSCVPIPIDLGPDTDQVYLALFGTGIRNLTQLSDIGMRIGGTLAEVAFAGAQGGFFGLDQINVRVPRSLVGRGNVSVIFSVAGRSSTPVTINIK
ncbi:MAG: hypothetical protein ACOYLF_18055, partial [Blastocatellia bacterium]